MRRETIQTCWIAMALLVLALVLLRSMGEVHLSREISIRTILPDCLESWTGEDILYCQNESCMRAVLTSQVKENGLCPNCNGPLGPLAVAEKQLLPADTLVIKKLYTNPKGDKELVSIVVSGMEQKSIHRPQQCLPGQGYAIGKSQVHSVPLSDRNPLDVMFLSLRRQGSQGRGRDEAMLAYWFTGGGRETPYHLERLFWMTRDLLFRNIAPRWAYISIFSANSATPPDQEELVTALIHQLYPSIQKQ